MMNNEEAIEILEEFKVIDDWTIVHLPEMEDAVDVAIEALKQVKTDGDTVSRQSALDSIGHDPDDTYDRIKSLPSAEPKTGEWVIHDEIKNIYGGIYIECSECGTKFVTQTLEDEHFCRNCGADMRKEESEEDHDYERAVDQMIHDIAYEPTYNPEDGSM